MLHYFCSFILISAYTFAGTHWPLDIWRQLRTLTWHIIHWPDIVTIFGRLQNPVFAVPVKTITDCIPGHSEDIALNVKLVRVSHYPVSEVLDKLVTKLHLLSEREVVSPHHHCLDQLTYFRLDLDRMNCRVQVTHISDNTTSQDVTTT